MFTLSSKSAERLATMGTTVEVVVVDVCETVTVTLWFLDGHRFMCLSSGELPFFAIRATNGFRQKRQGSNEWLMRKALGISSREWLLRIWSNTRYLIPWLYRPTVQLTTGQTITLSETFSKPEQSLTSLSMNIWLRAQAIAQPDIRHPGTNFAQCLGPCFLCWWLTKSVN